jgi:flagellar biosynthesis GTPase FlhF
MSSVTDVDRSSELARNGGRNTPSEATTNGEPSLSTDYEPRTYRGTDLEDLLPKIRAELGPDALVVRQREGLQGGVGGFFQRRCVEVVARRAMPRVNAYDDGPPSLLVPPPEPDPEPTSPAIREIMRVASPFVDQLQAAQADAEARVRVSEPFAPVAERVVPSLEFGLDDVDFVAPAPAPVTEPAAEPQPAAEPSGRELERVPGAAVSSTEPAPRTGAAAAHERVLVAAGIAPELAADILGATVSHGVPFAPNRALKHLVRDALAARIPVAAPVAAGRRAIAFVGSGGAGKTLCATRLAAAYADSSDLDVRLVELATGQVPEPAAAGHVITVVDTPAISPAPGADARALARQLKRVGPCEVHVAVPATLSAPAVRRLLDGLAALKPAAIVLTHLDEVDHAGPVIDAAIARGLALSYCNDAGAIAPADPAALAALVLP